MPVPNAAYFNDEVDAIQNGAKHTTAGELWTGRNPGVALPKAAASGTALLTYFTAHRPDDVAAMAVFIVTAQVTTPATLNKMALYTEASNGDLTRVATTASGTTTFDATGLVSVALTATYTLIPGQRYAAAILAVGSVGPVLLAEGGTGTDPEGVLLGTAPRMAAHIVSLTDLGASHLNAVVAVPTVAATTKPGQVIFRFV